MKKLLVVGFGLIGANASALVGIWQADLYLTTYKLGYLLHAGLSAIGALTWIGATYWEATSYDETPQLEVIENDSESGPGIGDNRTAC